MLKGRSLPLLRSLSLSVDGLSLDALREEYGVSKRSLYYDVSNLNSWLEEHDLGGVKIDRRVLIACNIPWERALSLAGLGSSGVLSAPARQAMIFLQVALSGKKQTISSLMADFDVSRNTVISDIREIKVKLAQSGIILTSEVGHGYELHGDEVIIRRSIWTELLGLASAGLTSLVRKFLQGALSHFVQNDIDYFELCRSLVKQYELDLKTQCFLDTDGFEGMMIQVSWLRGLSGHSVSMGRDEQATLMGTVSYRSVQCSVTKLRTVGITLPSQEVLYITSLLLGIKTADCDLPEEEDERVTSLASALISGFERVGCLTFQNKEYVLERLSHHIRPLFYRQKYGISAHNPLTSDVQKNYPMAFEFTRRAAIESGMGRLSDDELAYLTIYLSCDLDSHMLEDGDSSASKVLLVGAENMSVATLVKDQLLDACGIAFDYEYLEPHRLHRWTLESYALVLTLVPLPQDMQSDNMVEISPFLSEENKQEIYSILRDNRVISRYDALINSIIQTVGHNAPASVDARSWLTSNRLHFELFKLFEDRDRGITGLTAPHLDDSHINANKTALFKGVTWREAVLAGCSELSGASRSRLVERLGNIMEGGRLLYYHMNNVVTVVRCPMQGEEDARVEAQIVVSPSPIEFPDGGTPYIIICISTINRYSHWGTLYSIYQIFSDDAYLTDVLTKSFPETFCEDSRPLGLDEKS